MLARVVVVLAFVAVASAHLCLLNPPQRGRLTEALNNEAANECLLLAGGLHGCGLVPAQTPTFKVFSDDDLQVYFQKNANHWTTAGDGNFTVELEDLDTGSWYWLGSFGDTNNHSLKIFGDGYTMPVSESRHSVVHVTYFTSPDAGVGPFYQCADIRIVNRGSSILSSSSVSSSVSSSTSTTTSASSTTQTHTTTTTSSSSSISTSTPVSTVTSPAAGSTVTPSTGAASSTSANAFLTLALAAILALVF